MTNPSDEKIPVITASAYDRIYVDAGPGTGKTFTLIERLKFLNSEENLFPASQILVLSFSVSAVTEIKKRLISEVSKGECSDDLEYLQVRTFDSFASKLLYDFRSNQYISGKSYDERILEAIKLIKEEPKVAQALAGIDHILIDELQDLVSYRADLALSVLKIVDCGFTLFGDLAQGIYDFQIEQQGSKTSNVELLNTIKNEYGDLKIFEFNKNFRVDGITNLELLAVNGRTLIMESSDKAWTYLTNEFRRLSDRGDLSKPKLESNLFNSSTCVVCRDNGQVLKLARKLNSYDYPFKIMKSKSDNNAPSWVGRLLFNFQNQKVNFSEFYELILNRIPEIIEKAEELWQSLKTVAGSKHLKTIEIQSIREALFTGQVLVNFDRDESNDNGILLSTIHRSKGKEFNNVIVVVNPDQEDNTYQTFNKDQESKVLFVGLTRAKKTLSRILPGWMDGIHKLSNQERWVKTKKGASGLTQFNGIQVGLQNDFEPNSFARGVPLEIKERQNYLWNNVKYGTKAELIFLNRTEGCPIYGIFIDKKFIGQMSTNFGWGLWEAIKSKQGFKPRKFPNVISDIWVKEIVTEIGYLGDSSINSGFLRTGLWLGLRLEGIGICQNWE